MPSAAPASQIVRSSSPRVLVVDDESDMIELLDDALGRNIECQLLTARNLSEARAMMRTEPIDLMLVDLHLPDGSGSELLADLRKLHPLAGAVVITGIPSVDGAITAMRGGATDFLAKPFTVDELLRRVRTALKRQSIIARRETRVDRLKEAVRRLNEARRIVTKKVDLLCNDLVGAYGELSKQLDMVRSSESFRGVIHSAADLEQMLCHAMDWMLRQIGYCNVAIWLAADPGFQLGAYMKYTIPGEKELIDAMQKGLVPMVTRDGIVTLDQSAVAGKLTPGELKFLNGQSVMGLHCTYLGESLAQIILFREGNKPFTEDDLATMRAICPVFAVTLATMVREVADDEEGGTPFADGGTIAEESPESEDSPKPRKRRKDDEADWWKRGEPPPF